MKKRKIKIFSTIIASMLLTTMFCSCGNDEKITDKESDKSASAELVPNESSDFKWHEITTDEYPNGVGGIAIDGYVGSRTDIVIPKSISDKPVIMISDYAFSPYTEEDLTYNSSGDYYLQPEKKVFELIHEKNGLTLENKWVDDLNNLYNYNDVLEYIEEHEALSNITSISMPPTIEYIGSLSYAYCDNLEKVEFYDVDSEKAPIVECYYTPFMANFKLKSFNFYLNSNRGNGNEAFFQYCPKLEDVYLYPCEYSVYNEETENYDSYYGVDMEWVKNSSELKNIHIAEGTYRLTSSHIYTVHGEGQGVYSSRGDEASCKIYEDKVAAIYLPSTLEIIDEHVFCTHKSKDLTISMEELSEKDMSLNEFKESISDCEMYTDCTIIAPEGSYAESYAKENGISYKNS